MYDYEDSRDFLRRAKYGGEPIHYAHHKDLLAQAISSWCDIDSTFLATYVPTIVSHVRARGRDHAEILSKQVARYLGIPHEAALLATHSQAQARAGIQQRRRNPHYVCASSMTGRTIILLDDIATTRTSLVSAADALKKVGAREVIGVTYAYRYKK
ncbi:MAG TPA: phosphoribosyltransferase family protein [Acidimicrobiia bacterium]|nr:phosphoribosyltransferase family protein [Acidimicrobiia bacterium]